MAKLPEEGLARWCARNYACRPCLGYWGVARKAFRELGQVIEPEYVRQAVLAERARRRCLWNPRAKVLEVLVQ